MKLLVRYISSTPKGCNMVDQGSTLGKRILTTLALKGRNIGNVLFSCVTPFQGCFISGIAYPGFVPWAFVLRPFGAL